MCPQLRTPHPAPGGQIHAGTTPGFASEANSESIQATYSQAGNAIAVTLIIYNYSTPSDLQLLSPAFQQGQDRGLAAALFKTKAVGHCSITGTLSYDVAFIQMVPTPTGRRITFITSRPHPFNESDPPASPRPSTWPSANLTSMTPTQPRARDSFIRQASSLSIRRESFTTIWPAIPGRWSMFSIPSQPPPRSWRRSPPNDLEQTLPAGCTVP